MAYVQKQSPGGVLLHADWKSWENIPANVTEKDAIEHFKSGIKVNKAVYTAKSRQRYH